MMTKKEFGQRLYKLMVAKGWHHAELARQTGLPRNNVSTYINGRSYPSAQSLAKLARAFGMTSEELLPGARDHPIRGELPAELELRTLPDDPQMVALSINRTVPLTLAAEIMALLSRR